MPTVSPIDTQNVGDDGSVIFIPSKVAATIPGSVPRKLPSRQVQNGTLLAPKYILMASPGKHEITRRKKDIKKLLLPLSPIISPSFGCFLHSLSAKPAPETLPIQYGMASSTSTPTVLTISAWSGSNRKPPNTFSTIIGKNTVSDLKAYSRTRNSAAYSGSSGAKFKRLSAVISSPENRYTHINTAHTISGAKRNIASNMFYNFSIGKNSFM